jgi:hypothetical protein
VVGAIGNYTRRLASPHLPETERATALKFVLHLIGDVHQPLHVGHKGDHDGNLIKGPPPPRRPPCVSMGILPGGTWFGTPTNLHEVWDDKVIDKRLRDDFEPADGRFGALGATQHAYTTYLETQLRQTLARSPHVWECPTQWGGPHEVLCPAHWADESARLACAKGYEVAGRTVPAHFHFEEASPPATHPELRSLISVPCQGAYQHILPVIEQRLMQGAWRLAQVLEHKCTRAPPTPPAGVLGDGGHQHGHDADGIVPEA